MKKKDCYFLGKIIKKYGVKGQLVIKLDTDDLNFYSNLEYVFIQLDNALSNFCIINRAWDSRKNLIVLFEKINSNSAEFLIGKSVYLPLNTLPKLEGNKFYYHEVIGFFVLNQLNKTIGKIIFVNDRTVQSYFVLENNIKKNIYIPIIDCWITKVCRKQKTIKMKLPEGIESL